MRFDCEKYILETKYDGLRERGNPKSYEDSLPNVKEGYSDLYKRALKKLEDGSLSPIFFGILSNYSVFLYELEDVENN
jgi:hypothetical protein